MKQPTCASHFAVRLPQGEKQDFRIRNRTYFPVLLLYFKFFFEADEVSIFLTWIAFAIIRQTSIFSLTRLTIVEMRSHKQNEIQYI